MCTGIEFNSIVGIEFWEGFHERENKKGGKGRKGVFGFRFINNGLMINKRGAEIG